MKLDGVEIKKHCTESLLKYCKIYTFLIPFYVLFAAFFLFASMIPFFEPSMLEDMWVIIPIGLGGAVGFGWGGLYLFKVVRAAKAELERRKISEEEKAVAAKSVKTIATVSLTILAVCIAIILIVFSGSSGGSSKSDKPWIELGVSEREYYEIYNKIKYGE